MQLNEKNSLAHWVAKYAAASQVFMANHLDFCCGGMQTLQQACDAAALDSQELMDAIIKQSEGKDATVWSSLEAGEMIDEILVRFHQKHRDDFAKLIPLAQKVESVHQENVACPKGLAQFLAFLAGELDSHMQKEEQILFPMIKTGRAKMAVHPIEVMKMEHLEHGENLKKLKQLTNAYVLPDDACASWILLYQGLSILEEEIKEHISTENNILFPLVLNS